MIKKWQSKLSALFIAMMLGGCTSMGDKGNQAEIQNADYIDAHQSLTGVPISSSAWPTLKWWPSFHDDQLNKLMKDPFADSPTLKLATARVGKAMAFADTSMSALYPQANASLQVIRKRFCEMV